MFSAEKEKVQFVKYVDPNKKPVEDWMGELERMMKKSVRKSLLTAIEQYDVTPRKDWVLKFPG